MTIDNNIVPNSAKVKTFKALPFAPPLAVALVKVYSNHDWFLFSLDAFVVFGEDFGDEVLMTDVSVGQNFPGSTFPFFGVQESTIFVSDTLT